MVECEEEKYKFTYCSYFEYLANDKNQDKSSATDSIEVQTGRKQGLLGLIQRMKRSVSNRTK